MKYTYSVVRFVPDPARGEFVNVGAIVGSDATGEWECQAAENLTRARSLDDPDRRSLKAVTDFLERLANQVDEFNEAKEEDNPPRVELTEAWLHEMQRTLGRIIQLTPPAPVVADSPLAALGIVFDELIVDRSREQLSYVRKTRAQAALRWAYRLTPLEDAGYVFEDVQLHAHRSKSRLDFVVANGKVAQLAQAWSFQVPDQRRLTERIRSWAWTIKQLREHGAEIRLAGGARHQVHADVDVSVVYAAPTPDQKDAFAFDDGLGVFEDIGAFGAELGEAETIAERAADLLAV